ncbi:hypothetical protein B0H12DRAFT_1217660 [Mycena haematopus]|nr:hypothetical protein B0H12DRAFT_1217660 [Mycena haematopus]
MFKRVDKRRRKQEEEKELGLDDDAREVLGLNDTDSDESDSDSDESESEADGAEEGADSEGADSEGAEEADEDEDSSDEEDREEPPISVEEALQDPVYVVSLEPDVKACIACPGKLLKNAEILKLHRASKACLRAYIAHERRWRQFREFAKSSNAAPDSNAWDVLKQRAEEKPKLSLVEGSAISKQNKKREEQKAKMAARRAKKREAQLKRKAKKSAASEGTTDASSPPKKKRKVEDAPAEVATEPPIRPPKTGRSPRNDRLERQGKLQAKLTSHEAPGGRGKGNGKKKAMGGRGKQGEEKGKKDERGKRKKDNKASDKHKPLQIFD